MNKMSFPTAYHDLKRTANSHTRGLIRDKPEKQVLDEYYKRMRNWSPINGRK